MEVFPFLFPLFPPITTYLLFPSLHLPFVFRLTPLRPRSSSAHQIKIQNKEDSLNKNLSIIPFHPQLDNGSHEFLPKPHSTTIWRKCISTKIPQSPRPAYPHRRRISSYIIRHLLRACLPSEQERGEAFGACGTMPEGGSVLKEMGMRGRGGALLVASSAAV